MTRGQQAVWAAAFASALNRGEEPGDAAFLAREHVEAMDHALAAAKAVQDELTVAMLDDMLSTGADR